jgi:regulatory protein YycH of two-component signal transduction system YycFG
MHRGLDVLSELEEMGSLGESPPGSKISDSAQTSTLYERVLASFQAMDKCLDGAIQVIQGLRNQMQEMREALVKVDPSIVEKDDAEVPEAP